METPAPSRSAIAVTQLLLIGCAICEIVICSTQLVNKYPNTECAYWPAGGSTSPCNYLIALGGVAIASNMVAVFLQFLFGRETGSIKATLDVMLAIYLFFWWIAGGSYFTHLYWVSAGNGAPSGADSYRKAAFAVAWTAVGLSALSLFLSVASLDAFNAKEKKEKKEAEEKQHRNEEQISVVYAAPPA